ncbi:MAG: phage holin family protein [Patescibacteria group bacterium]
MKQLLMRFIQTILAIALLSFLVPTVRVNDYLSLIIAGIVLSLLQMILRPILKIMFLPINIVTLGLFSWVINVFILWLATQIVPGFAIQPTILLGIQLGEFGTLVLMSFLLSLTQTFIGIFIR